MRFLSEQMLVQQLDSAADLVKTSKESSRLNTLWRELEPIHFSLEANPTSLPIGLSTQVLLLSSCYHIKATATGYYHVLAVFMILNVIHFTVNNVLVDELPIL